MTLRFTTSRAVGAAIALTIGTVSSAAAQTATGSGSMGTTDTMQDSTTRRASGSARRPARSTTRRTSGAAVRKDASGGYSSGGMVTKDVAPAPMAAEPAPAPVAVEPAPLPAPVPAPEPVPAPAPEPVVTTTTTTTTTTETPRARFGNGFYIGLGGGANFPQNELNNVYDVGPSASVQFGVDPTTAPIGLRLNLGYNRLNGTTLATTGATTLEAASSNLYSALLDAKLRLPFGRLFGATSGLYAVGGGGVTYFQNYQTFERVSGTTVGGSVGTPRLQNAGDATRFAANGGLGLDFGIGPASLFAEGRYVRVFTRGRDSNFIPVTLGLRFHTR
jgi:hypothetical protein